MVEQAGTEAHITAGTVKVGLLHKIALIIASKNLSPILYVLFGFLSRSDIVTTVGISPMAFIYKFASLIFHKIAVQGSSWRRRKASS
jgi:hypothetical protein